MSLRIQSTVDVTKMEVIKTNRTGAPMPTITPQGELESARQNGPVHKQEVVDKATVESAVQSINGAIEHINRSLRFSVHEDTQQMMVKVVDVVSQEVIKEIPPEDVLDTVARIREAIGLLIDERA